jgi:hypothetical protein
MARGIPRDAKALICALVDFERAGAGVVSGVTEDVGHCEVAP